MRIPLVTRVDLINECAMILRRLRSSNSACARMLAGINTTYRQTTPVVTRLLIITHPAIAMHVNPIGIPTSKNTCIILKISSSTMLPSYMTEYLTRMLAIGLRVCYSVHR
jgi:hypothetical protein